MTLEPPKEISSEGKKVGIEEEDPYFLFLYGMNLLKQRKSVLGGYACFLTLLILWMALWKNVVVFSTEKAKEDNKWAEIQIIRYLQGQRERCERKEIIAGTLKNRFQAIRLFCKMNEIIIPWIKISKVYPGQRNIRMIDLLG